MREIKFRVIHKQKSPNPEERIWREDKVHTLHLNTNKAIVSSKHGNFSVDLNDAHLIEFTGLKDKNGTDIYEGDIINRGTHKYRTKEKQVIHYDDEKGRYIQLPISLLDNPRKMDKQVGDGVTKNKMKQVEVIGNRFENEELLEG